MKQGVLYMSILFATLLVACSPMRIEYGYNHRNKTTKTSNTLYYSNGNDSVVTKRKFIYPRGVMDAAAYIKSSTVYYDAEENKIAEVFEEKIVAAVWGYEKILRIENTFVAGKLESSDTTRFLERGW